MKALIVLVVLSLTACATTPSPDPLAPAVYPLPAPWPEALPQTVAERFDRDVADRRFIALGEGDHYIADKYPYRLAFLRELVRRRGLRHVALEMGASDVQRVDAYFESGDERWLDRVVLLGFTGESERERRDLAFYTRLPEAHWRTTRRFADAEKRFYRSLRGLSEEARAVNGDRLHLFGFDLDATPGGGYEDGRRLLELCRTDPAVSEAIAGLSQPDGIAGMDEVRRLEALVDRVDVLSPALDAACGASEGATLRDTVDLLAASLRYFLERAAVLDDPSPSGRLALRDVYDRRERRMDARLAARVEGLPPGAPVALLLHNVHAARDSEAFRLGRGPAPAPMWKSIGTLLEARHPGQTYVTWLLYADGTRLDAREPDGDADVRPANGTLEERLRRIPGAYVAFLDDVAVESPFDAWNEFGTETSYASGVVRGRVDALVFLPEASAP